MINSTNANSNGLRADQDQTKCPYKPSFNDTNIRVCPINMNIQGEYEHEGEGDEKHKTISGCPVLNLNTLDALDTNFSFNYELPFYGTKDFFFDIQEGLENKEFLEKTKILRSMPRHLKYTLFHLKEEKIKKIRKKEFTIVYFVYEEIRIKANKLYNDKKYSQCLNYLSYAYSCFKWLEFTSENKDVGNGNLVCILDEDVKICRIKTDSNFTFEEKSFNGCLVSLLKIMSFAYIQLRNFTEAISTLNEAIEYSDDKVPELYFRRSQARTYNKNSDLDELNLALNDINKAKEMKSDEPRFVEHYEILKILIEDFIHKRNERVSKLISNAKYSFNRIKQKCLNIDDHVYLSYSEIDNQWKMLQEMWRKYKYTLKFHNEMKNEKQISIVYREIETFREIYLKFRWYYSFDLKKLTNTDTINEEDR